MPCERCWRGTDGNMRIASAMAQHRPHPLTHPPVIVTVAIAVRLPPPFNVGLGNGCQEGEGYAVRGSLSPQASSDGAPLPLCTLFHFPPAAPPGRLPPVAAASALGVSGRVDRRQAKKPHLGHRAVGGKVARGQAGVQTLLPVGNIIIAAEAVGSWWLTASSSFSLCKEREIFNRSLTHFACVLNKQGG